MKDKLNIATLGHKCIPSREGGIEIVVKGFQYGWSNLDIESLALPVKVIMNVDQNLMIVN